MMNRFDMPRFNPFFDPDPMMRSLFDLGRNMDPGYHRTHVREEEDRYILEIMLPGIPADRINVSVRNDILKITVAAEEAEGKESCRPGHRMRMERSWTLEGIDKDSISAENRYGVLYVYLPKEKPAEEEAERKIPIQCENLITAADVKTEA